MAIRSYPEEVQNRVRNNPHLAKDVPKEKSMAMILLSNLLLFAVVFSILGIVLKYTLGLKGYRSAFWYFLAFGEGLELFDLIVIDLLWWRSIKRIRFLISAGEKILSESQEAHRVICKRNSSVCCGCCDFRWNRYLVLEK